MENGKWKMKDCESEVPVSANAQHVEFQRRRAPEEDEGRDGRGNSHIDTLGGTVLGLRLARGDVRWRFVIRRVR